MRPHPVDGSSALDAALWYAKTWGVLVAPADPTKKKPLITTGKYHSEFSSREAAVIRAWAHWQTRGTRVAVVTGPASGALVLDGDQKPGIDGVEAIRDLEERLGTLPESPRSRTGHGEHRVYRYPSGASIRNSVSKLAPGVDIRGIGGIFIAPPAPDRSWFADAHPEDVPLAELPSAWIEALLKIETGGTAGKPRSAKGTLRGRILEGEGRNTELFSLAGTLRRRGLAAEEILGALREVNVRRCVPPLDETELHQIAHGVERYKPELPTIDAGDLDLRRVTDAAWRAVVASNDVPYLFRFGGIASRVENTDDGTPTVRALTEPRMRHVLARVADWYRMRKSGDTVTKVDALPPEHVVNDMLARPGGELPLPVLARVVEAPVLGPNGTLELTPGYHPASRAYYHPVPGFVVPNVPLSPSDRDVERARTLILDDLLGDFPFAAEADRAHAVALLLLPFVREMIEGSTPLHLIEKPTPGTGATLLAEMLTFPALGRAVPTLSEGRDEDEWRKRITAKLMSAPSVILLDNLRRRLDSSALSAAITSPVWEDRVLGRSEVSRVSVRCAWIATGNNPATSSEMARRTVRIRLDARVDRPWLRDGWRYPDLRAWAYAQRGPLVWSALVLARAWVAAGMPRSNSTLGMFDAWAAVCGGILETVGITGMLANATEFYETADSEGASWRALIEAWWEKHGDQEVAAADLWKLANPEDGDPIDLPLGRGTERSQRTRFGLLLSQQRDRQYGLFRVTQVGTRHRLQQWRLVRMS